MTTSSFVRSLGTAALLAYATLSAPLALAQSSGPAETKLRSAREITIKENDWSWGKEYKILVGGEQVATVSGKGTIFIGGDVFTLKTSDGTVLAKEQEVRRGLFQSNRSAVCYDRANAVRGYIGEESGDRWKHWSSFVLHVYDANKREVGMSKKTSGLFTQDKIAITDQGNRVDYTVQESTGLFSSHAYKLTVLDPRSEVPLEHALFLVCIEDALRDAHD